MIINFIKNEIVFVIACLLAIISAFIVTPSEEYLSYIDFRTLSLLLALMLVVQGLKSCGVFDTLVNILIKKIKTKRQLALMLVCLCFFSSMLITNDVALITFVPFTIMLLALVNDPSFSIYLIVLETIAANLGSMFTPIGNPQNLYLYSISNMSISDFLICMLPYTVISFLLLFFAVMPVKAQPLDSDVDDMDDMICKKTEVLKIKPLVIYGMLFLICILTVLHILDFRLMLVIVLITVLLLNYRLLAKADYVLLLTFVAFFIFIGNMKNIPAINDFLNSLVTGRECGISILASQVVSNVPAAMLLSGFTTDYTNLLIGVNLGGLGTLIASMASLISFKFYCKIANKNAKKYILMFTLSNIIFLAILFVSYLILN